jgi:hypothetical protein
VDQCFFITDPTKPTRVVVRRGKRNIIRMDGVTNEQDFDMYGDPKMEDESDTDETYTTRSRTTLPKGLPFKRRSPSVSCTPMYVGVPSTAAELDAVKVTHFSHRVT